MKKQFKTICLCLFLMMTCQSAFAGSPWSEEVGYGDKVRAKVVYGMANFWGGWISLFYEPIEAAQTHKNILAGVGKGLVNCVVLTIGGLGHLVTAPMPFIDIPLPHNGVDLS